MFLHKKKLLLKKRIESTPNEETSDKKKNTATPPQGVERKKKNRSKNRVFAYGIIMIIVVLVALVSAAAFLKNGGAAHRAVNGASANTPVATGTKARTDKAEGDGFVSITGGSGSAKTLTLDAIKPSAAEDSSQSKTAEDDKVAKAENIFSKRKASERAGKTKTTSAAAIQKNRSVNPATGKTEKEHDSAPATKPHARIIVCSLRPQARHTDAALLNIFVKRPDGSFDYKEDYATIDEVNVLKFAGRETGTLDNAREIFYIRMKKPGYIMEKQLKTGYSCQE